MLKLPGKSIYLRALEATDLDFLYQIENEPQLWEISGTTTPYSRFVLKSYLENSHKDIYEAKQLRLAICSQIDSEVIGLIDLFDFEPKHRRAGIGIVINGPYRTKGYGSDTLKTICDYGFRTLELHQLYANVLSDNPASLQLFEKIGFTQVGIKKDWVLNHGKFKNEILLQKINPHVS
ncbi:GNAT family N-acetyltransferase [Sediminicola luteus]|uniref:GNAT family N-acetyltransferase n=1 Tax=Sediminicola luteus TaxID=319238 RepID=A0A2A4G3W0_9FLAO|nr:GNAT family N-acetyltransferase [Sediminicola luteus]PCE63649.1 GNAT family N-acetyltransferase [Sediminicola luteus]